ncbi:hypothetical protein G6F57_000128 [Rhizopus arrhizus]|uniref:Pyrroline-5-carboxylate reductase n=1 Tax=Rhizopus oryzae TaxID=64495 RepID=A0A9P7BS49_RHIOR|nr:hypothetical protein G6F23_011091 [Rhizopus arrhizus]KAG1415707.1 hypothetical protein G6F58_006356 [Rhizopus delemar]KAG0762157.1 hypothetical protein G6F24_007004 [Rhizopus arrhizus]KAG0790582.1 hypothetical protein G6F21_005703 [Rhizopus arrhizus]KAG0817469.1 hypothetical protein G6F20_002368 [Rhizopus arrhizus]
MTVLTRLQTISSHISTKVTSKPVISFIGAGNMTEAILSGLQSSGYPPSYLRYSEPVDKRRDYMESKYPQITGFNDNTKAVQGADVVILAVKPQVLRSVITSTTFADSPSALIISLVGGITIRDIDRCLNTKHAIVRCMPNTPALIGEGAVGLYATEYVNSQQRDLTENIMKSISKQVSWINDESLMNTVTAISGSGPAYFFLMMEAMQNAAVEAGLSPEIAKSLVLQTCIGAARMAQVSQDDLSTLRRKVTSPNGTTEAAIKSFESNHFRKIISDAVFSARDRGETLAEEFSKV